MAAIAIESALSGALLKHYQAQLAQVRQFVAGTNEADALSRLRTAMTQLFTQSFTLPEAAATVLAQLATEMPPRDRTVNRVVAVVERCALQRAFVAAGLVTTLRPYLLAAARGAAEGFALDPSLVLTPDSAKPRANIPTLPPIHSQNRDLEDVGPSPLFTERFR